MVFKKMIQLLAKRGELLVVCVLDACSSNYGFEELTLKDNSMERSEISMKTYFWSAWMSSGSIPSLAWSSLVLTSSSSSSLEESANSSFNFTGLELSTLVWPYMKSNLLTSLAPRRVKWFLLP